MIKIHSIPDGIHISNSFELFVRQAGAEKSEWLAVPCRQICVGHQRGEWNYSGLAVFDFEGKIDLRVRYLKGRIDSVDLRPHSYKLAVQVSEEREERDLYTKGSIYGTMEFSLEQDEESSRKIMLRINDSWDLGVLHLMTNRPERSEEIPDPAADNVLRIRSGDEIPLYLPEGKDTYYFDQGIHRLPRGLWALLDLEEEKEISSFVMEQAGFGLDDCGIDGLQYDPPSFVLEGRKRPEYAWTMLHDGRSNKQSGRIKLDISPTVCRQIKLTLLGNTLDEGWIFSSAVSALKLFDAGGEKDLALGKAVAGAIPQYTHLTDGRPETVFTGTNSYSAWHAGEAFFLSQAGTRVYLSSGAEVYGSIAAENIDNLRIDGRGVLNASILHHQDPNPGEARSGAVWLTGGENIRLEGITILDAPMWQVVLNYNRRVVVKDINLIGYVVNADGIHLSGCEDALVENVFVRACDDLIVLYHYGRAKNIRVRKSVFMNDDAHVVLLGLGEREDADISEVLIEDCDIISQQEAPWLPYRFSGVFKLWAHGGNSIKNVRISDIRIDSFRYPDKGCVFQLRTERRFEGEGKGKSIENVIFENISIESEQMSPSLISAGGEDSFINRVLLKNIRIAGKDLKTLEDFPLEYEGLVSKVSYEDEDEF